MNCESEYQRIIEQYRNQALNLGKLCSRLSWMRLAGFLLTGLFIYLAFTDNYSLWYFGASAVCFAIFLYFVQAHSVKIQKLDYTHQIIKACEKEIQALQFNFLHFPDGAEFIDNSHANSSDIDLFGQGSAFQYINRTVTSTGKNNLADWFKNYTIDSTEIIERQEACKELTKETLWRLNFQVNGQSSKANDKTDNLLSWLEMPDSFKNYKNWKKVIFILRITLALSIIISAFGFISYNLIGVLSIFNLFFVMYFLKKISHIHNKFENNYPYLSTYSGLLKIIEESNFKSTWLKKQKQLLSSSNSTAYHEIKKLYKLLDSLDARNNLLVAFFRNSILLSDLNLILKIEEWKRKNKYNITKWIEAIGNIDALNSLATFSFNNPNYIYPIPVNDNFILNTKNLGHLLIPEKERVCNDFQITGWHQIKVLTGANMAGKSTFLRTVGLNLVLAHTGAPVCADYYEFKPCLLMTSIRTNDSLIKHESYFYAELKKLKSIIDTLEQEKEVFILLDEVLKGTNSIDKLNGSIILVKKLLNKQTSGIIATHDLALGELEKEFPSNISNICFEADIFENQLHFDYKIRIGTAKKLTAIFLMKQMNIV